MNNFDVKDLIDIMMKNDYVEAIESCFISLNSILFFHFFLLGQHDRNEQ